MVRIGATLPLAVRENTRTPAGTLPFPWQATKISLVTGSTATCTAHLSPVASPTMRRSGAVLPFAVRG